MKEQIENKIADIIKVILDKPANKITMDDYTILTSELRDIRFRESQEESNKRMAELFSGFCASSSPAYGNIR